MTKSVKIQGPMIRVLNKSKRNIMDNFSDYSYFNDVAKFQKDLTREEEEKLFSEYSILNMDFKRFLLLNRTAQNILINLIHRIKGVGKSIAKLHSKFDNNKPGHNQAIIKEMNDGLDKVDNVETVLSKAELLYKMGFSKEVYDKIYAEVFPFLSEKEKEKLSKHKERIKEIENKLTCSALKMAISIAQKYTAGVFGMSIKDAIQEATIGIYESVNLYDPNFRTKNGKKIKFSTYANIRAEKRVKEKIMETSRLIRLPKSRLDVLFTVLRACATLHEEPNIEVITGRSNDLLEKRKKRKLKDSEILTEERVLEAITLLNNNCIMLDSPVEGDSIGELRTFADIIPDCQMTAEDNIVVKDARQELVNILRENLDYISESIIFMRYFDDPPKSHQETAEQLYLHNITKKKLSKEAVRQKETLAFKKLKDRDINGIFKNMLLENISMQERLEV